MAIFVTVSPARLLAPPASPSPSPHRLPSSLVPRRPRLSSPQAAPRPPARSFPDPHLPALDRPAVTGQPPDGVHEQRALGDLDPLMQRGLIVVIAHGHGGLRDDRAAVGTGIDEEDGAPGDLRAVVQRVPDALHAGKR